MNRLLNLFRAAADPSNNMGAAPQRDPQESTQMLNIVKREKEQPDVTSSVVMVTPSLARHFRDTNHFPRQRNISQQNVKRLANEMSEGRFTPGIQIYFGHTDDGQEWMLNGNHTCEAIYSSGVTMPITVTRMKVRDEDHAGMIYAVFDIQKLRSWNDSLRAYGAGEGIPNANAVLSAIGVIEDHFGHRSSSASGLVSRVTRMEKMEDYREAAIFLGDAMDGGVNNTTRFIKRAATMAVALETFRYQPSLAFEFWGRIAKDDGLRAGDPERAFLLWARNKAEYGIGAGSSERKEWCKAAAAAWNAKFAGEQRQFVKPNAMIGFKLSGTPISVGG